MEHHTAEEHFVDLEIRIFQRRDEGYPVEMILGGQQEFPRGYLAADIVPWVSSSNSVADGQRLSDALLADNVLRSAWAEARGRAPKRRIRLRIDVGAAELHTLPWELLREDIGMLAAQADTPFSRYLPIALPWSSAVDARPIRMLVVISNPSDLDRYRLAPLDVALERGRLEAILADMSPNALVIDFLEAPVTLARLEAALREGCHILHFVGHGAFSSHHQQAALYLQAENGTTQIVLDDRLVGMLARQGVRPHLVFLAACQSATRATADAFVGLGPKLVSAGVPAVVAMQDFVSVETAQQLGAVFYQRLLEHGHVDLAMNEARSTLLTTERPDAAVPVLFMRLKSAQLWGTEADARGHVLGDKQPRIFWSGLLRMIQQGKCIPILGPRVHGRWSPTPEEIALNWAELHGYPFADRDELAQVAQYLASSQGEDFPRYELLDTLMRSFMERLPLGLRPQDSFEALTQLVNAVGWSALVADDPNEVHRVLADLPLPLYLTTNCDSFMQEALRAAGRRPARELCRWNRALDELPSLFEENPDYRPTQDAPLVYHLFGTDEQVDSLVLTTDNHLDFLVQVSAEIERIPHYIRGALANSSLMFLGYRLTDWEFRVVMRGLVATMPQRRRFKHVAVQLEPDDMAVTDVTAVQSFLAQYFQGAQINVFWGSIQQFVAELHDRWETHSR